MIDQALAVLFALATASTSTSEDQLQAREAAIEQCTAMAEMLASAYVAHPDDVQARTKLINEGRERLEKEHGTTDRHLMSAYPALAFYDGSRIAGTVPIDAPINGLYISAKGAAQCMASTFNSSAL